MSNGIDDRETPVSAPTDTARIYPFAEPGPSDLNEDLDKPAWQGEVAEWIRENQTLAMALGFALGVFLGVMMRD